MPKRLVRKEAVAEYLCQKPETIWKWTQAGYIPCFSLGRDTGKGRRRQTHLYDLNDIDKWVDGQKSEAE